MDWRDGEARGSLPTIREARVDGVGSQEERACLVLSHGEESGRDTDQLSEAPCPVLPKRRTSSSSPEKREMMEWRIKERLECQTWRSRQDETRAWGKGRKMFYRCGRKRSQEVEEKEGKTESKANGNEEEGKGRIRGEENRKAGYNAAVVSVSCVPPSGRPGLPVKEPRLGVVWDPARQFQSKQRPKVRTITGIPDRVGGIGITQRF